MMDEYLRVFRAFSDEKRLRVLEILTGGEKCACDLLKELHISQPTLSYHMKVLAQAGIVKSRPVGPWKYYSIDREGCAFARAVRLRAGDHLNTPANEAGRILPDAARIFNLQVS